MVYEWQRAQENEARAEKAEADARKWERRQRRTYENMSADINALVIERDKAEAERDALRERVKSFLAHWHEGDDDGVNAAIDALVDALDEKKPECRDPETCGDGYQCGCRNLDAAEEPQPLSPALRAEAERVGAPPESVLAVGPGVADDVPESGTRLPEVGTCPECHAATGHKLSCGQRGGGR